MYILCATMFEHIILISYRSAVGQGWLSGLAGSLTCYPIDTIKRRIMIDGCSLAGALACILPSLQSAVCTICVGALLCTSVPATCRLNCDSSICAHIGGHSYGGGEIIRTVKIVYEQVLKCQGTARCKYGLDAFL